MDDWSVDIDFNLLWNEIVQFYNVIAGISISFEVPPDSPFYTGTSDDIYTIPFLWLFVGVVLVSQILDSLFMGLFVNSNGEVTEVYDEYSDEFDDSEF